MGDSFVYKLELKSLLACEVSSEMAASAKDLATDSERRILEPVHLVMQKL